MTITPGSRLGPYEILSPLGAGGMGEVWRARDTRLAREVAVKVLPESLSADRERVARFEHEARSASALNHPNIVTIFDLGRAGVTFYIAMELVEGKTLRELLAEGPLPMRRALSVAAQVADGLAKAHAAAIVHRDLKPENLMVSSDGFVKILDFGLAKLVPDPSGALSQMLTAAGSQTQSGVVLGTVGYMSPEQASGAAIDIRSDQFSFGAILYEMVTGRRPFSRATPAETLTAIIREEAEPVGAINPEVPAPLRWIIERCLAKDPRERYVATEDLAREIKSVRNHLSEPVALPSPTSAARLTRRRLGAIFAASTAALAAGVLAGLLIGRGSPRQSPTYKRLTFRRGAIWSARFAPDGQTIVYSAAWDGEPMQVFSTRPEGIESRHLGLPPGKILSISSRGEMALAMEPRIPLTYLQIGTLARASLSGGTPRELLPEVHGADWSPDGQQLAVLRFVEGKDRLEYPAGKVLYEASGSLSDPRVSPDGERIALMEHFSDSTSVITVGRDGQKKELSGGWRVFSGGIAWSPKDDEIWFSAARGREPLAVYAQRLTGPPRLLLRTPDFLKIFDVARDGRILLAQLRFRTGLRFGTEGKPERELSWLSASFLEDLSVDGGTVVFTEIEKLSPEPGHAVYLRKTDGSPAVALGEGYSLASGSLSPDGRWVLAISLNPPGRPVLLPTGAGEPRALSEISDGQWAGWFPDGRRILLITQPPGHTTRTLLVLDLASGKSAVLVPRDVRQSLGARGPAAVSPDGKWVAAADTGGAVRLYPVDGGEPRLTPGFRPEDELIRWSADSRSLFTYTVGMPGRIFRIDLATGRREVWRELTTSDPAGVWRIHPVVVSADGKSYAYSYSSGLADLFLVEGVR
jgi:serine/threonine protein kinase